MRVLRAMGYLIGIIIGTIYLLNPTAGLFELLPDNIPFIGHLDEIAAVGVVISGFKGLLRLRRSYEADRREIRDGTRASALPIP